MVRITRKLWSGSENAALVSPPLATCVSNTLAAPFFIFRLCLYTETSIAPIMKTCHLYLKIDAPNSTTTF